MTAGPDRFTLAPLGREPTVSAFMPARNAEATIEEAIRSIRRQPEVSDIVVALGPSEDGTDEVLARLAVRDPQLRIVLNPSGRIPDGLNRAWRHSRGEVLVRVDAHSVLPEGYVARALTELRHSGAANVGGVQRPVADTGFRAAVAAAMSATLGSGGAVYRQGGAAGPADTVYLGVFRREALEHVGGYDERFERNEDAELNIRLAGAGLGVWFSPLLAVDYLPRGDLRSLAGQYFANGRWRRLTAQVHPESVRFRQVAPSGLVLGGLLAAGLAGMLRRRWPLLPVLAYLVLLGLEARRIAGEQGRPVQIALALVTMHLSFGAGFLVGPPTTGRPGV